MTTTVVAGIAPCTVYWRVMPDPGDDHLAEVYAELRRLARGYLRGTPNGATLQPTALVHEAYLSLSRRSPNSFEGRTHFLGVAALAMRQILVQHYRRSNTWKRGAGSLHIPL